MNNRQEKFVNYPRINHFDAIKHGHSVSAAYKRTSDTLNKHIKNLERAEKQLSKRSSEVSGRGYQNVIMEMRHAQTAVKSLLDPFPGASDLNIPSSLKTDKDAAERAWNQSKVAWAEARILQYPRGGIPDSILAWNTGPLWDTVSAHSNTNKETLKKSIPTSEWLTPQSKKGKVYPFYVPILVVENKKSEDEEDKDLMKQARNQRMFYCVSAIRMLSELGIKDFPVIGLATAGELGSFCAAWWSSSPDDPVWALPIMRSYHAISLSS